MESKGIWQGNKAFKVKGQASNYEVLISPEDESLEENAARPMEMLLNGIVGCMGAAMTTIMRHHIDKIEHFEITIDGQRAEAEPKVFTHYDIYIEVKGDILPKEVKRAVKLAEDKYCSAINSVNAKSTSHIKLNSEAI